MDRTKLVAMLNIARRILPDGKLPDPEELDCDDDAIAAYAAVRDFIAAMDALGYEAESGD